MTSKSSNSTVELNYLNRIIWLMINIFFGGFISLIMMVWVSCDMEMPAFFFPILPSSFLHSIFHLRWIEMNLSLLSKILFNTFLFSLFGFVHTFFAQDNIQQYLITKLISSKISTKNILPRFNKYYSMVINGTMATYVYSIMGYFKTFLIV